MLIVSLCRELTCVVALKYDAVLSHAWVQGLSLATQWSPLHRAHICSVRDCVFVVRNVHVFGGGLGRPQAVAQRTARFEALAVVAVTACDFDTDGVARALLLLLLAVLAAAVRPFLLQV